MRSRMRRLGMTKRTEDVLASTVAEVGSVAMAGHSIRPTGFVGLLAVNAAVLVWLGQERTSPRSGP